MNKVILTLTVASLILGSCSTQESGNSDAQANISEEAQNYLDTFSTQVQALYYTSAKAEWKSNIEIIDGDSTNSVITRRANEAVAKFTGSIEAIEKAQYFLSNRDQLSDLQIRQFKTILYGAANNPQTVADLVKARIKAETEQNENLYKFNYVLDGDTVSTNDIDQILDKESNLEKRLAAWSVSKEVGVGLKTGLANLRDLRNQTVQALSYNDYFGYQVSDYGMTSEELRILNQKILSEIWPLYRELHTYARYKLADKYGAEVPEMLPAHWLPNRWGQDWAAIVDVEGLDLEAVFAKKDAEWIVKQGERFYMSLGFPALPAVFWEKSSLYPLPDSVNYKKNDHASAWHLNLEDDVRSLMSVIPNTRWYETSHHELGHIYYYMTYTNPEIPLILRAGANRGFHEAMGSLMGLAAMQKPFLDHLELLPKDAKVDEVQVLLKEALNYLVFLPWSAGVMSEFEYALYAENLPVNQFNQRWWDLKKQYQGIVPPSQRGEEYCDAASKTHINNDAAQYYDYGISYILLFQFHDYIATQILKQDPHATNYYGSEEVGKWLYDLMYPGASRDWRELLKEMTGEDMSARAMLDYFAPLSEYLDEVNADRVHSLPALFN